MESNIYLVPYDFTPTADGAVTVAINMAHHNINEITVELIHFVKTENEVRPTERKLKEVISKVKCPAGTNIRGQVIEGNHIEDIGKMAKGTHAKFVVMGTHGMVGLQKVFGMDALKVITHSTTPFIVVQDYVDAGKAFDKIVVPVNLAKESLQTMHFTTEIAREFNSEVHLVAPKEKDEWLHKKVVINIKQARTYLTKEGIKHDVAILDGDGAYEKQVVRYAMANGADLIALAYFHESVMTRFDTFAQKIIMNSAHIPVLAVNATDQFKTTGSFWTQ